MSLGICDYTGMATGRQPLEVGCITTTHSLLTTMVMSLQSSLLNFSVGLGAVRLLMLYDCILNGRLSSNVDGHVDNYVLILCSMPLTMTFRKTSI